jgi:hypothetical protein
VSKFTLPIIAVAAALACAPVAHADAGRSAIPQVRGGATAPAPLNFTSECDENYAGACVPVDSDVDCEGGSGNGPSYVAGPVSVVGSDIYDLDRDGNGTGCEQS